MEKFKIFILFALFIGFAACENDEEKAYIKPADQVSKPVLSLEGANDIEIDESTYGLVPAIISWTKADIGADVLMEYALEMASAEDFADAKSVIVGNNVYTKSLTAKELSDWAVSDFGGLNSDGDIVKVDYYIRIVAGIFLENPKVTVPPQKQYSNSIKLSVLPYYVPPAYLTEMYMIGEEFGKWDWGSTGVVEMTPVHSTPGHFWAIRYFTAEKGFKWNSQKSWTGAFKSLGEDIGFYTDNDNAYVNKSGLYMIYIDTQNKKISIEEPKVYGMGDCFGGWNMATYPLNIIDGNKMSIMTTAAGELRMYANSNISPIGNDWWKMEFIILNGKIAYRGKGDDQERVNVAAGKTVTLDFNVATGTIE